MKSIANKAALFVSLMLAVVSMPAMADGGADVIVNNSVSAASVDKAALKDILLGKTAYWQGGEAVVIVVLKDKTDSAIEEITGMSASAFRTYWQRLTFSGRGKQPKEADSEEKLLATLAETKGAIALVPSGTALNGVKKLEVK
jgi:ABC-type phosphate transport system substrate-binding protein